MNDLRDEVVHRSNRGESNRRISIQLSVSRWKVTEILRLMDRYPSITVIRLQEELQSAAVQLHPRILTQAIHLLYDPTSDPHRT